MSVADIIRTAGPIKLKKASDLQRSPGGTPIRQKKDSMEENEFFRVLKAKFKVLHSLRHLVDGRVTVTPPKAHPQLRPPTHSPLSNTLAQIHPSFPSAAPLMQRVREESAGSPDSVDSVTPKTGSTGKSASRVLGGGIEDDKENSSPQQRVDALMKAMEDVSAVTAGKGGRWTC